MPTLDLPALKKQIDAKKLGLVHLFVGEDVKLIDRMVDAVEATVDPADQPFAVERMYAGEVGAGAVDIVASARALPMLGDRRIVFVLRAERLFKPKRASKAAAVEDDDEDPRGADEPLDTAPLEEYLASPVPSTCIVFVATDIDRGRRLTKRLLETALVTAFGGLSQDGPAGRDGRAATTEWIQSELTRSGRSIDPEGLRLLAGRAGGDITKLRGDVERLLLFTEGRKRISSDDVMDVVSDSTNVDDEWAVVNAIANGESARALTETARRLERGDSPHALVGQLRWWVSARLSEGDPGRVAAALDALLRTDLALKSSGGDPRVLIERLVVELTGKPLASRGWSGSRR